MVVLKAVDPLYYAYQWESRWDHHEAESEIEKEADTVLVAVPSIEAKAAHDAS